jgi:hypothetical protein
MFDIFLCKMLFSRMKLKEIDRTAMQAWSPAQNHPIYLATGKFKGRR